MGRAHRPSAIRHRPASALRSIRCRYIVMHVTRRTGCNVASGRVRRASGICGYVETRGIVPCRSSSRPDRCAREDKKKKPPKTTGAREKIDRPKRTRRSTGEKSRKPGAAVGAFIAYGSAKHLWNNGAGEVHRWRRKTKVFSTRENPQDRVLLLAAGRRAGRSCSRAAHIYTHTLEGKIDTFSVSIPGTSNCRGACGDRGKKSTPRVSPSVIRLFHVDFILFASVWNLSGDPQRKNFLFYIILTLTCQSLLLINRQNVRIASNNDIRILDMRNRTLAEVRGREGM